MPKTGTHILIPFLEKLTGKRLCTRDTFKDIYIVNDYDHMQNLLSDPDAVLVNWCYSPVSQKQMADAMDFMYQHGLYLLFHCPYLPSTERLMLRRNCVVFFVVRDPRDYVVSLYYHVKAPNMLFNEEWFHASDMETQLTYIINGTNWFNSTHTVVHNFIPWRHSPACCALRFEKLIGPSGGACTFEEHLAELRKITDALHLTISDGELLDTFNEIYGTGATFRRGVVGTWREYFKDYHKEMFKAMLGDVLIGLGYERDYNW
jgi:hypothetical protein